MPVSTVFSSATLETVPPQTIVKLLHIAHSNIELALTLYPHCAPTQNFLAPTRDVFNATAAGQTLLMVQGAKEQTAVGCSRWACTCARSLARLAHARNQSELLSISGNDLQCNCRFVLESIFALCGLLCAIKLIKS